MPRAIERAGIVVAIGLVLIVSTAILVMMFGPGVLGFDNKSTMESRFAVSWVLSMCYTAGFLALGLIGFLVYRCNLPRQKR